VAALVIATAPSATAASEPNGVRSVVVVGDSVAAGEGTLDGYVYRDRRVLPGWWSTTLRDDVQSQCGRSDRAYGAFVADALGAAVTNLACSGATFDRGLVREARYRRARPDLVLVTAGANSVDWERAFAYCAVAARGVSDEDAARIADAGSVPDALIRAVQAVVGDLGGHRDAGTPGCTARNPGAFLERTVLDRIDGIEAEARALAREIRARGRAAHASRTSFSRRIPIHSRRRAPRSPVAPMRSGSVPRS
jgi:hypothetical protein